MKTIDVIAAVALVVGGFNWGLIGLFDIDVVSAFLGGLDGASRAVYIAVGLCALYQSLTWKAIQRRWALAGARAQTAPSVLQ
jgi:uncharacterized membrane protein YuzA (DUF378 family)